MITTLPNENANAYETTRTFKNALDKIISFYFGETALIPDGFIEFIIILLLTTVIITSFIYSLVIMLYQYEPNEAKEETKQC